jgi:hypothetical protein
MTYYVAPKIPVNAGLVTGGTENAIIV